MLENEPIFLNQGLAKLILTKLYKKRDHREATNLHNKEKIGLH